MDNPSTLMLQAADMLDECASELGDGTAGGDDIADRARAFAASLRASATARDAVSEAERLALDAVIAEAEAHEAYMRATELPHSPANDAENRWALAAWTSAADAKHAAVTRLRTAREVKP